VVTVGAYTAAESRAVWSRILALLDETGSSPLVDSVHPFDKLKELRGGIRSSNGVRQMTVYLGLVANATGKPRVISTYYRPSFGERAEASAACRKDAPIDQRR